MQKKVNTKFKILVRWVRRAPRKDLIVSSKQRTSLHLVIFFCYCCFFRLVIDIQIMMVLFVCMPEIFLFVFQRESCRIKVSDRQLWIFLDSEAVGPCVASYIYICGYSPFLDGQLLLFLSSKCWWSPEFYMLYFWYSVSVVLTFWHAWVSWRNLVKNQNSKS